MSSAENHTPTKTNELNLVTLMTKKAVEQCKQPLKICPRPVNNTPKAVKLAPKPLNKAPSVTYYNIAPQPIFLAPQQAQPVTPQSQQIILPNLTQGNSPLVEIMTLRGQLQRTTIELNNAKSDLIKKPTKGSFIDFRKKYSKMVARSQRATQIKIKLVLEDFNKDLAKGGLHIQHVNIENIKPTDLRHKSINIDFFRSVSKPSIDQCLYFKDRFSISERCYKAFRSSLCTNLPSLYLLNKHKKDLNERFGPIKKIQTACFLDVKLKFKLILDAFFQKNENNDISSVKIKLGLDGTIVSNNNQFINFVFTILNEGKKAATASGNYTLGIIRIEKENYDSIEYWLKDICQEINKIEYSYESKPIEIITYFGGDYKVLLNVLGLKSANSNYPCILCKVHKKELHNVLAKEDIQYRSYQEQHEFLNKIELDRSKRKSKGNKGLHEDYGYNRRPMLEHIPHSRFIICVLHLLLRISDLLFDLLIKDIDQLDKKSKNLNLTKLFDFLELLKIKMGSAKDELHITNDEKGYKILKVLKSLNGGQRKMLFEKLAPQIENMFSNSISNANKIQTLWTDFYMIYNITKTHDCNSSNYRALTQKFLKDFCVVYDKKNVTPYFHYLVNHMHDYIEADINLGDSSTEGLEKLNDMTTFEYFKATNKKECTLDQLLYRRSRIDYYEAHNELYSIQL